MEAVKFNSVCVRGQVFAAKEEGWSESVAIYLSENIEGFVINPTTKVKEKAEVDHVSVFIGAVIKAMCAADSSVAAFLSAKSHDEKVVLVPMLLANSEIEFTRQFDEAENEYITELVSIKIGQQFLDMINKALLALFSF